MWRQYPTLASGSMSTPRGANVDVYHAPSRVKASPNGSSFAAAPAMRSSTPSRATPSRYAAAAGTPPGAAAAAVDCTPPSRSYGAAAPSAASSSSSAAAFITQVSRTGRAAAPPPGAVARSHTPTAGSSRARGHDQCNGAAAGQRAAVPPAMPTLPPVALQHRGRQLLVLDLDETLVHATIEPTSDCDRSFTVAMSPVHHVTVYVKLRPGVREFMRRVAAMFEVCVFTASLAPYADQVVDYLDPSGALVHHRLYREHCTHVDGVYVKDLSLLARPLGSVAIVDNSPVAYSFHPDNAIPILSWFDDPLDTELSALMPLLDAFARSGDIYMANRKYGR